MTRRRVTLTRSDVRLLHALASLAEHVPERMRAGHLAERARELAERLAMDCTDTQQEVDG
jgi:hypothetical protein